jgi:hypothetical protein
LTFFEIERVTLLAGPARRVVTEQHVELARCRIGERALELVAHDLSGAGDEVGYQCAGFGRPSSEAAGDRGALPVGPVLRCGGPIVFEFDDKPN